jgi:chromosomal replication initiation ATPase DnaA
MTAPEMARRRFERATARQRAAAEVLARAEAALDSARQCLHALDGRGGGVAPARPAVREVQNVVCEYYQIPLAALLGPARTEPLAGARLLALALCRRLTPATQDELAIAFGRSTGLAAYAARKVRERAQVSERYRSEVALVTLAAEKALVSLLRPA